MIKPHSIEMIEKSMRNNPTITVEGSKPNYFIGGIVDGKAVYDIANGTYLFEYEGQGDDRYTDFTLSDGTYVNAYDLTQWISKELQVSPKSYVGDYKNLVSGTTLIVDNGILKEGTASSGDIYFIVKRKINFDGKGIIVEIAQKS